MESESVIENKMYYIRHGEDIFFNKSFKDQKKFIFSLLNLQFNSENLHILIGSGCSLPAIPLMGQTFYKVKELAEVREALGKFGGDSQDIEGYLNWLRTAMIFHDPDTSEFRKFEQAYNSTKIELLKSINLNYHNDFDDQNSDDRKTKVSLENYLKFYSGIFAQREFKKLSPINVFTTNYDLFNEVAMELLGIHYTNGFRGSINRTFEPSEFRLRLVDDENRYKDKWNALRRYVKLYKIHGSIDWKFNHKLKEIVQSNVNLDEHVDVMIYPTVNKHYETQQTPYSELFREFTINLQKKNSTLIVLGYGFPDDHINQLISQSLNNEDFTLIVFGNKNETNAAKFIEKHREKHNLHFIGGNNGGDANGHHFSKVIEYLGSGEINENAE
ncbi:SIR2 family protein [Paenibacillus segetis]|uniref:SIR2-like domain-containing protein n=1 Tax=Paenibacillus segetis TaxID=1325360 RepID=A0ABQ1Y296_9BACL|nr:SIR2 family protein [Paenibacillus segetis]GGH10075.1 hypothetical protein GCM10008013_01340 [Paenibacillus segetis]